MSHDDSEDEESEKQATIDKSIYQTQVSGMCPTVLRQSEDSMEATPSFEVKKSGIHRSINASITARCNAHLKRIVL